MVITGSTVRFLSIFCGKSDFSHHIRKLVLATDLHFTVLQTNNITSLIIGFGGWYQTSHITIQSSCRVLEKVGFDTCLTCSTFFDN